MSCYIIENKDHCVMVRNAWVCVTFIREQGEFTACWVLHRLLLI